MTSQRRSRIEEIARAALARDPETRDAFLREACANDPALRLDVDAWLGTHGAGAPESPTASVDAVVDPPPRSPAAADLVQVEALLVEAGRADHYRILSRIGAGGMGVVYKALDLRLNRAVALKVIRRGREMDSGRLRKEALTAASLDHPYICKVYELIETQTEQLIVMEFLEGETLSRRLSRGIPPLATTLQLAIEIAEGLANAHERGLVHRDLKPGNVMVTSHGHIKLLDFGLARHDATSPATADTQTATQSTDARAGTPYYMAPEQAEGRPVTARADVFALGVVLFECVTGRLPFEGLSRDDYVNHLRVDAPKPVRALAPDVPGALADLIDRCLAKTPAHRPESARQVVQELRRVAGMLSTPAEPAAMRSRRRRQRWSLIAAVAALVALGVFGWRMTRLPAVDGPDWRSRPFVTSSSEDVRSRISPDGQWISYLSIVGGDTQLLVRRVGGRDAQRVELPAGTVIDQLWSPDGNQLAYLLRQGSTVALQVVPAFFGGTPTRSVPIVPAPVGGRLLRWIDRAVYAELIGRERSLQRVDVESGVSVNVTSNWTIPGMLWGFDVSHDGRRAVFTQLADGQEELWTANLDGTSPQRLTETAFFERHPLWSGAGTAIFYQSNRGGQIDLWQLSLDSGVSRQLTSSQATERPESASSDGTLVTFVQVSEDADLWVWNPATGGRSQLTADALSDFAPSVAATGSTVVFQRTRPTPLGFATSDFTLFTGVLGDSRFQSPPRPVVDDGHVPRVSPDGSWLAYLQRGPNPGATLFVKHLQTNQTLSLSSACRRPVYSTFPQDLADQNIAWSPSGAELYFVDGIDRAAVRRYRTGAKQADPPLAIVEPGAFIRDLYPSPDGGTLAYMAYGGNVSALHLLDLASVEDRSILELPGAVYVRGWLANNAGLVLVRPAEAHEDLSSDVEVLVVSPTGTLRPVGRIDHAFLTTMRLDADRAILYFTRSEAGVHNLYTFSLRAPTVRRVTDNAQPGVTFSGVHSLGVGGIIGVRTERESDIWLLDAAAGPQTAPGRSGR